MLSPEYPPNVVGGLGAHVGHLAPLLAGRGVNVHVVTPNTAGGDIEEQQGLLSVSRVDAGNLPADFLERTAILNDYVYRRAKGVVAGSTGPWLIHAHDWLVGEAALRLKHSSHGRLLTTIHATEYGRNRGIHSELQSTIHNKEHELAGGSDHIIACSHFMAAQIGEIFEVPASTIDVIPNGVDVARLLEAEFDRPAFRAGYALPEEAIVLYVGRLVGEKGIYVLLEAIPRVLEVRPRTKFIAVGSGPSLQDARERAAAQAWSDHMLFTGFVPDQLRNRLYRVADLAIFPSLYEPFGIVALEAMALGVPVVASNAGGLTEVVQPEETGVVVDAGSADSLAWGIVHVLEQPELARQRAERARLKATTDFTWDGVAGQTVAVYKRMLAGG